jgi:hypothetical protein
VERSGKYLGIVLAMTAIFVVPPANSAEPKAALSPMVKRRVDAGVAALHLRGERALANAWTPAKQVAEILCSPYALDQWKKKTPPADRIVLGDNTDQSLTLLADDSVEGDGMARTSDGWTEFRFQCHVNAGLGKVDAFTYQVK